MTYIPLSIQSIRSSHAVTGVAIGRGFKSNLPTFVFTGGSNPMIAYLDGDFAGHAFELSSFKAVDLVLVDDIEFEVEEASMEIASLQADKPVGGLILTGNEQGMVLLRRDAHGFHDAIDVYFDDPSPATPKAGQSLFFPKWRAVRKVGHDKHVIFEMNAQSRVR